MFGEPKSCGSNAERKKRGHRAKAAVARTQKSRLAGGRNTVRNERARQQNAVWPTSESEENMTISGIESVVVGVE
jgi:hypothetical protein